MDREFLIDLFSGFGPVTVRPMFSGFGISADGINFAISIRAGIFLRAEPATEARFAAEGCAPFEYETKARKAIVRSYWQLPERLLDDPDELADWARMAFVSAQKAALAKPPRKKATPRKRAKKAGASSETTIASAEARRKPKAKSGAATAASTAKPPKSGVKRTMRVPAGAAKKRAKRKAAAGAKASKSKTRR